MKPFFPLITFLLLSSLSHGEVFTSSPASASPRPRKLGILTNDTKEKEVLKLMATLEGVEHQIAIHKS
jgi:hypothetical protein